MSCLMKRTPCSLASSPSSCGSIMTNRDLSYSRCRSISGKVPLPIEPKPIMTMGPEMAAWICRSGGLMVRLLIKAALDEGGSGGASLRGHFDLDLHLGLVEPCDDEQRCGRPDIAKLFTADREHGVRIPGVGDVIGRADDIGECEAAIRQRAFDGLEAVSCLARDIRRHCHGGVVIASGAGNEGEIAVDHGAAVTGSLFERRAGGYQAAWH